MQITQGLIHELNAAGFTVKLGSDKVEAHDGVGDALFVMVQDGDVDHALLELVRRAGIDLED